jgi:type I restriction enzyme R subunit
MNFELFDPDQPIDITFRRLPHWYQPGATYFVTFRTEDSLPKEVINRWHAEREEWLLHHDIDPRSPNWQSALNGLPELQKRQFHSRFSREYQQHLDGGYGECLLRRPELAQIVGDSLLHFDGTRYQMGDFVIMPNHVHLLVYLLGTTTITDQCFSWKKFTATQLNRRLGRRGHFWQAESFDHLVRNENQFGYLQQYIADNPRLAGLHEGEYLLYQPPLDSK